MRSTRFLLAAAGAAAVVGIAAPGAHSADGEWEGDKSSYSREDSSYNKDHDKDDSHDAPHGGIHTGGGALTAAGDDEWGTARDPKHDPETYKDKDKDSASESDSSDSGYSKGEYDKGEYDKGDHGKGEYDKGEYAKPSGGIHTGGGALASPAVTAGGLAVLAVAGTGLYAARRNRSAGNPA